MICASCVSLVSGLRLFGLLYLVFSVALSPHWISVWVDCYFEFGGFVIAGFVILVIFAEFCADSHCILGVFPFLFTFWVGCGDCGCRFALGLFG